MNKYITLKLENNKTYIYVNNRKFLQCIRLVLQIPRNDIKEYDQINSIDEAAQLNKTLYNNRVVQGLAAKVDYMTKHTITPEEEFKGHCSNIQAWVENYYDTRILHSNISFPLLRELAEAGDPAAERIFKDEIGKRYMSGFEPVKKYLINRGYLDYLNKDELAAIGASDYLTNPPRLYKFKKFDALKALEELVNKLKKDNQVDITVSARWYNHDFRRKMGGGAVA